jgi:hypothetical protein
MPGTNLLSKAPQRLINELNEVNEDIAYHEQHLRKLQARKADIYREMKSV